MAVPFEERRLVRLFAAVCRYAGKEELLAGLSKGRGFPGSRCAGKKRQEYFTDSIAWLHQAGRSCIESERTHVSLHLPALF
jgi:hypothetical protein